jgi:thioredoxin-dependent peroxiredoxin
MRQAMALAAAALILTATGAQAALQPGAKAPPFRTTAAMGGKTFAFELAAQLKKGPVVLYFYPAAFTPGCTIEARQFAEAVDDFNAQGATVIGVSRDSIDKLQRFSVTECRSKFAVASDSDGKITKAYDAVLKIKPEYADRTSYVISPQGVVLYEYTALSPDKHVSNTLAAVKAWKAKAGK